jgi:uncharacterized protein (DUF2336 family)
MVTFLVSVAVMAFKPSQRAFQNRQTGFAEAVIGLCEAIAFARRKALTYIELISRQNIHDVMSASR